MFRSGQHSFNRRGTPRVVDGIVQKKNNWKRTPGVWNTRFSPPAVIKEKPGKGYRHVVSRRDVLKFVELIPEWETLAAGLYLIVLTQGWWDYAGRYSSAGRIHISAWGDEDWQTWRPRFYHEHAAVLQRLGVPCEQDSDGDYLCKFNPNTIRAWQLLHIFLHELGHHHDRMATQSQRRPPRGERYAEEYALRYEQVIWDRYRQEFEWY